VRGLNSDKRFLSTEEAAEYLGVSVRTVTAWAKAYEDSGGVEGLRGFKLGKRKWSFEREKLLDWISRKQNLPPALGGSRRSGTVG
jgi:excisionase family DNA binding protein